MKIKQKYFTSWLMAIILFPLIGLIGYICQIYTYDKFDSFFMAGFIIHGYLVVSHPWVKYSFRSIVFIYIAGILGAVVGYLNESNSIVIALMATLISLHYTSTSTNAFHEYEKLSIKEQRQIRSIKWLKSMAIGMVAFLIGANVINSIKTTLNNNSIKLKFKQCSKTIFKTYKNHDAIAIAKCYNEKEQLKYINYYFISGEIDDSYIFNNNKLYKIYDFKLGYKSHYLQYKFDHIQKQQDENMYKAIRTYYKYMSNRTIKEKSEVSIDYIEDELTIFTLDGLTVYYTNNEKLKEDVGTIYKNNKIINSKKLTINDIKKFR